MMLFDILHHFPVAPARRVIRKAVLRRIILNQFIRAMARFANAAIHQRVGKSAKMPGGFPGFRVHQNCAVQPDIVRAFLHKFLPPHALDIVFQLNTERTVIPCVCKAAVNLGAAVYKASALAKRNELLHRLFRIFHVCSSLLPAAGLQRRLHSYCSTDREFCQEKDL